MSLFDNLGKFIYNEVDKITAPARVITAPFVAAKRFITHGVSALSVGKTLDQSIQHAAESTASGFQHDLTKTARVGEIYKLSAELKELRAELKGDSKKVSKAIDMQIDKVTGDGWSAGKKVLDSTKLTNIQEKQVNAVKAIQQGQIWDGMKNAVQAIPLVNPFVKGLEKPETIQPPSGESIAKAAMVPVDLKTKGYASKILAVTDSMKLTKVEQSISHGWNALVQGRIEEAIDHFSNAQPGIYALKEIGKGTYFSNLSKPDAEKVVKLIESAITKKYGIGTDEKTASQFGKAAQTREAIKNILSGDFDKVFTPEDPEYHAFLKLAGVSDQPALQQLYKQMHGRSDLESMQKLVAPASLSMDAQRVNPSTASSLADVADETMQKAEITADPDGHHAGSQQLPAKDLEPAVDPITGSTSAESSGAFTGTGQEILGVSDPQIVAADTTADPGNQGWSRMYANDAIVNGAHKDADTGCSASVTTAPSGLEINRFNLSSFDGPEREQLIGAQASDGSSSQSTLQPSDPTQPNHQDQFFQQQNDVLA